jgi:general secretion pathway protein F
MAVFEYRGIVSASGKAVHGVRDAENVKALRSQLRKDGILLTTAAEEAHAKAKAKGQLNLKRFFERPGVGDIAIMTRQLATLVRAGIPLFEALSALIEQVEKEGLRRALTNIRDQVREGTALADALHSHPKIFSTMYVNMVRAGEASGTLEAVLTRLTSFMENQARLKNKVGSALAYPVLMMLIAVGLISVLMVTVVPKVTSIFESMNATLPWHTRALITVSEFTSNFWWLILMSLVGGGFAFRRWKNTDEGKLKWHTFMLRVPVFGPLVQMVAIARFTRTLATLLAAGVALLNAMGIVRSVLGNARLEQVVADATTSIREGQSIAEPLKASGEFPPLVTHMIAIGERSGQLEEMLENVADAYDQSVDNRVQMLTSLLEPIIIVIMGAGVGFIAWAILSPLIQVSTFVN